MKTTDDKATKSARTTWNRHGYCCKTCGRPTPTGIGYTDFSPGAYEMTKALDRAKYWPAPCGH